VEVRPHSFGWRAPLPAGWLRLVAAVVLLAVAGMALDPRRAITQYLQSAWATDTGLPQTSVYAISRTADGYLWVGTELGLARFDGVRVTVFDRRHNQGLAANYTQKLLAARDGSLRIGTDDGLTNVPPGSYRFQVEAAASDGAWSGKGANLQFELRPHVCQTAWFRALCAAILMACGAGLYLLRVRYLVWLNRELERKVAQRTEELAKTARSLAAEKAELIRARAELERLATRDGLTGAWNRTAAFDLLGRVVDWCRLSDQPAAVIMCDLDGFKKINDRHGHPVGDLVLREIALRLQAGVRASDYVGRYGGEEFLIILPDCSPAEARVRAEQLRRQVESAPVEVAGAAFAVTCSFGVSCSKNDGFDGEALVRQADQALYRAKGAGKNRVEVSEEVTAA
jgi:diguanylate cyclase (GGDEF)-like protein